MKFFYGESFKDIGIPKMLLMKLKFYSMMWENIIVNEAIASN